MAVPSNSGSRSIRTMRCSKRAAIGSHVGAAVLVGLVTVVIGAACSARQGATLIPATPLPAPSPTAVASAPVQSRTPRSSADATPTSRTVARARRTEWVAPTPTPSAIRMTEAEVRAAALGLLDPESSPRVHLVRLVPFGEFNRQVRDSESAPYWMDWFEGQSEPEADHPVYVAAASGDDIHLTGLMIHNMLAPGTPLPLDDRHEPPNHVVLVVLLDAVTGREGAFGLIFSERDALSLAEPWLHQVARLPAIEIDEGRSAGLRLTAPPTSTQRTPSPGVTPYSPPATRTPTPTVPLPPRGAVSLDTAALDHDQAIAISEFPLRAGARWIYRSAYRDGYRWTTERITAEVEAGWRLDDGVLLWQTRTHATRLSPSPIGPWPGPTPAPAWGYGVFPRGEKVIAYRDGTFFESDQREGVRASEADAPEISSLPALAWWPLLRLPLEPGGPWFIGETWSGQPSNGWYAGYSMIGRMRVTVPAGTFDNCTVLRLPIGAGATEWRWFCAGVGFVRQEGYGNNPGNYSAKVELVEFSQGR